MLQQIRKRALRHYPSGFLVRPPLWPHTIYAGTACFSGEDHRSITLWDWLNPLYPLWKPRASISFNRLLSNTVHSLFIERWVNFPTFGWPLKALKYGPANSIKAGVNFSTYRVMEPFDYPIHIRLGNTRIPLFSELSFLAEQADTDIGCELHLWAQYHFSDDVTVQGGWARFFTRDALHEGNFNDLNGLAYNGGTGQQDADYFYLETGITF